MDPCTLSLVPDGPLVTTLPSADALARVTARFRLQLGVDGLISQVPPLPMVPVLLDICRALSMLASQRSARVSVPFGPTCRLVLDRTQTLKASLSINGQPVLRAEPIEFGPLVHSVLQTVETVLDTLQRRVPTQRIPLVQTLRTAKEGLADLPLERQTSSHAAPPSAQRPRSGIGFRQLETEQLAVDLGHARLVLDGCPAPVTAPALVALVRQAIVTRDWPMGQQTVPIDPAGLHVFLLARTPTGMALTVLDGGQHPLCAALRVALSTLAEAAWRCVLSLPIDYGEYRQTLAQLLRWAQAIERSVPRPLGPPGDWNPPDLAVHSPKNPLPVRGLHHLAYRRSWRVEAPGLLRVSASRGRLLVFDQAGVRALASDTAQPLWDLPALRPLREAPVEAGIDDQGRLVAFDGATGQVRWRAELDDEQPVAGAVADSIGWVAHTDSTLFGIDAQGQLRWRYAAWYGQVSRPVVHGPLSWCVAEDGFMHAIRTADGARQFVVPLTGEPEGMPALTEKGVLVLSTVEPSGRGALAQYDHIDGRLLWRVKCEGSFAEPPCAYRGRVFALLRDGDRHVLEARSLTDGVLLWRHANLSPGPLARLHPVADLLCLKSAAGEVLALSIRDGGPCWRLAPDDTEEMLTTNTAPIARRGILLVPGAAIRVIDPHSGRLIQVLDCGELTPDWLHVWANGDLAIAEDDAVVRYTLGGHLALVR